MYSLLLKMQLVMKVFLIFWSVVERIELLGFKVLVAVCDGASPNRRFIKLHVNKHTHKASNPYSETGDRPILSYRMHHTSLKLFVTVGLTLMDIRTPAHYG